MKKFVSWLMIMCMCVTCFAESRTLVINNSGYYMMIVPQDASPRFEKIDVVIDVRNGEVPTTPTNPGDPTANPLEEEVKKIAQGIASNQDAALLSAVYGVFAKNIKSGAMSKEAFDLSFDVARRIAAKRLEKDWGSAFAIFDARIKAASDLGEALQSIADGLAAAAGTTASSLVEGQEQPEYINMEMIMIIINAILKLLELLGALD